jgi:CelD/BcsL family acetyltransferase involved in cellulose biosynthesis
LLREFRAESAVAFGMVGALTVPSRRAMLATWKMLFASTTLC